MRGGASRARVDSSRASEPGEIATSLAALAADKSLTDTEKADIDALLGAIQFDSGLDPFSGERRRAGMPQRRARDPKTGKFVKGGVDHSALEELFRGGP